MPTDNSHMITTLAELDALAGRVRARGSASFADGLMQGDVVTGFAEGEPCFRIAPEVNRQAALRHTSRALPSTVAAPAVSVAPPPPPAVATAAAVAPRAAPAPVPVPQAYTYAEYGEMAGHLRAMEEGFAMNAKARAEGAAARAAALPRAEARMAAERAEDDERRARRASPKSGPASLELAAMIEAAAKKDEVL